MGQDYMLQQSLGLALFVCYIGSAQLNCYEPWAIPV